MVSVVIPPWAQSRCETPCVGSAAAAGGRKARVEEDAVSLAYRFLYRIGFTPWEEMEKLADQIVPLFEREENGAEAPYGPVLDIGCGSGIWATKLARRGWQVTGVDNVPRALTRARERAREEGVEVRFVEADVTKMRADDVGSSFRFLFDFGCFHDELTDEQRAAEGRAVSAVAAPGATLLLWAFSPGRRGPLPRGASRAEIEASFPEWTVVDETAIDLSQAPGFVRRADPRFYRLRHD
jgi:SAM-dependent methyltransferase